MYACIYIPDFTVEAVLRAEPMLRGRAVAVLEGKPPLCYVVSANEAARHLGVEIGMTKLLAETLQKGTEGSEEQQQNRRSKEPKNEQTNRDQQLAIGDFTPRCFPHDNEREKPRQRRPHSQGAYEATYGRMDTRFGLYRTRLEADELSANNPASAGERLKTRSNTKEQFTNMRQLALISRSSAQEESAHAALLDAAHSVSPRVEDSAMDTVVVDVAGLDRLFGTPQQVAQELVRRLTDVGLVGNVAIAGNPDAAEHAARGFTGVTIIPGGREGDRLGTLPLEVLFDAERSAVARSTHRRDDQRKATERFTRMQETLDRWGIRNFRGLASLPPVSLSERLGTSGVRLQTLASGTATRELVFAEPPLHFEESIELEYPVDVLEPLAFLLARMIEGLCGRLAARALSTNELRLRMKLEHRTGDETAKSKEELNGEPIVERKLSFPVPMNDARLFLKLLQLELSASPPGAPVTQLWLEAEPARPRLGQAGLFQPLAPEAEKLELTLARLHKLLAVRDQLRAGSAEPIDTHQPDSFKVERFTPKGEERHNGRTAKRQDPEHQNVHKNAEPNSPFGPLSLRRFRPSLPAIVDLRDGIPSRLSCAELGARDPLYDNIVWAAGPWQTSGNWWEAKPESKTANVEESNKQMASWKHEEWDIALALIQRGSSQENRVTQIGLYRLVHNCARQEWSIDGGYD
ncbi:MAG TPA: hypothetical protein VF135_02930 [Terriglobales bacterium]